MAHYSYLDNNNIVVAIIVGKNETELIDGLDTETYYALNTPYTVKRTSYNGNIRKQYAGVGYSYDAVADVFIAPQPYASWTLDNDFNWQPPTPRPEGMGWYWNEIKQVWIDANEL
jgi:hypothetical protein